MTTIRPFAGNDTETLLALWARALPYDAITLKTFEQKVLLDPNYISENFLVAEDGGKLVGFILGVYCVIPFQKTGLMPERGWITAMGVDPAARGRGIGSSLLAEVEKRMTDNGRKSISIAPYPSNYFVPGIDRERYPEGLTFFTKHGFKDIEGDGIAMDAPISTFTIDAKVLAIEKVLAGKGIIVRTYQRSDLADYMSFMREIMPGPWVEVARHNLYMLTEGMFEEDSILLAIDNGKIIGYCQFEREHFGPFGVSDDYQGQGIGSVLLARTLYQMRIKGLHSAWVLWTGDRAAKGVYGRLGFVFTRRFAVLAKTLAE
jgi:mycothiol synthase